MKTSGAFLLGLMTVLMALNFATAAPDQPHMAAALELLQAAKKADKPLPMLNAAKKHLQQAAHNKSGERKEALAAVNEAIAQVTVGNKDKMAQKINNAIAQVHSGMANAK